MDRKVLKQNYFSRDHLNDHYRQVMAEKPVYEKILTVYLLFQFAVFGKLKYVEAKGSVCKDDTN